MKRPVSRKIPTAVWSASASLLVAVLSVPAYAQTDESLVTACGRQAKDAGVTGAGAVSAYVAKCVAEKQAQRALGEEEKNKDKDKDKDKDKTKEKSKDKDKDKKDKKDKKGKKDKKS